MKGMKRALFKLILKQSHLPDYWCCSLTRADLASLFKRHRRPNCKYASECKRLLAASCPLCRETILYRLRFAILVI